jgi:DNA ligase-1
MNTHHTHHIFPVLYGVDKNGKTKVWNASVMTSSSSSSSFSMIEFGQEDGKKQVSTRDYDKGKNIGKKNETTPLEQCMAETERKWKDKKEKEGYTEDRSCKESTNQCTYFPMLAQTYDSKKNKKNNIVFPCFVQPKLDGLRCLSFLSQEGVVCQSRTGGIFETTIHIQLSLEPILRKFPDIVLDGELYTDKIPFEELAGLIKKKKLSDIDKERMKLVSYHVYDCYHTSHTDMNFIDRSQLIFDILTQNVSSKKCTPILPILPITLVSTIHVENEQEFKHKFSEFVAQGYEGIMLRNKRGVYHLNYRSHDLQKYKEFMEDEYEIVNFKEGDGRDKGTVIWVCSTKEGHEFNVRPRGTNEMRRDWFNNGSSYVGKMLTVIYQELSDHGIPRFPVGKSIRDGF